MKLPQISGLELIKILHKFGFQVVRRKGSHVRLEKTSGTDMVKITVPMHNQLKKGTLLQIIKESNIPVEEWEKQFS